MSRLMIHGVLGMPRDGWGDSDSVDAIQRESYYKRASEIIQKQDDNLDEVKKDFELVAKLLKGHGIADERIERLIEKQRHVE